MKWILLSTLTILIATTKSISQDSSSNKKISLHYQATLIPQYAFKFNSPYTGTNSFISGEPVRTSFTTTLFAAYKPFKNTYLVFNPELAAGKGLSQTLGIAGFPNGEIYRVGDPKPQLFVARLYAEQRFPLSSKKEFVETDENQIKEKTNTEYISLIAGKFALTDFFDDCEVSHDPRTQFMNWSLMANGAWDYPANVRGYVYGAVAQAKWKKYAIRAAITAVPMAANEPELQFKGKQAMGSVIEFELNHFNLTKRKKEGYYHTLHIGFFSNHARMGNYQTSINTGLATFMPPDITDSRMYGRAKNGYYFSLESHRGKAHHFIKHSKNDGQNETWAFTEIDASVATGFSFDGSIWKRRNDNFGVAYVRNDLSEPHKQYLKGGGYGFIIGDGKLNYASEQIIEAYYSLSINNKLFLTPDYQFVLHPAYNADRGPVHVVSLRLHFAL
ncbi:MAG: carbohydrate porin [Bacteroidetes bacterium]|nr:carbohydrate porin [Bacteroidota bacterium]